MSGRTIVRIGPMFGGDKVVSLVEAPFEVDGLGVGDTLDLDPREIASFAPGQPPVRCQGEKILRWLKAHRAVAAALDLLSRTPRGQVHELFFQLEDDEAERLRFEALYEDRRHFLALEPNWRIARIAGRAAMQMIPSRELRPPLRFMAVLSALGRPAAPEWKNLRRAVERARRDGLEIELRVIVGEASLKKDVERQIAAGLEAVSVELLPDRSRELETQIDAFAPHLLHFFCHGSAGAGVPRLELATHLDHLQHSGEESRQGGGDRRSSIHLQLERLLLLDAIKSVWLVTLNCCEGGQAAENHHSMAHGLVEAGVPAVVGMLEPIDVDDAHEFCEGFYPDALESIGRFLRETEVGETGVISWLDALWSSRVHLVERHPHPGPEQNGQWTLPVLYLRPEMFQLKRVAVPTDTAIEGRVEEVAGILRALPPDAPMPFRRALLDLLADVDESLLPDDDGRFPAASRARPSRDHDRVEIRQGG